MAAGSPRASPYIVIYSANLFILVHADAEVEAQFITDGAALLDFFAVFDVVDDGEDDVGDVLFAVDGEFEHGVIGLDTEFAARQFQIAFLIRCIHADRNGI